MPFVVSSSGGKFTYASQVNYNKYNVPLSAVTINSVTAGSTGTGLIAGVVASDVSNGTAVTNGVTYNVYSFQPGTGRLPAASSSSQATYTINYSCTGATTVYVLAVGGGGGGGSGGGGGGGAGGVVMLPVNIPAGTSTINVAVGSGGVGGIDGSKGGNNIGAIGSSTTVTFNSLGTSPGSITAYGGGASSYGSSSVVYSNGSNPGFGWNAPGTVLSTNTTNYNYVNIGGNSVASASAGGGGGAGTPGLNSTSSAGGTGGNGIQCFLPGIVNFSPSGNAYGTYYWGGGGGGMTNSTTNTPGNGGLGGGGGSGNGNTSGPVGSGGSGGLNIGGSGGNTSGGNGGNAGANTGGGGGGSYIGYAGAGGSGIVVIAFPSSVAVSSNQSAVLPSSIVSSNLYNAVLNNATLTTPAYSSIKAAFACRLINYNYFGPTVTLRHSLDTAGAYTQNFYADICGNMGTGYLGTGQSLSSWLSVNGANTTYAYVTKWYNQGMDVSFNCATQYTLASQPIYDVSYGVINFGYQGVGGGVSAPATQCYLNLPDGAFPYGDSSFSYITKIWNTSGTSYNLFMGAGGLTGSNNNAMYFDLRTNNTVNAYVGQINLNGAANASNNVVALTYNNAGGTSSRVFYLYSYNNGSETQLATGNPTSVMTQYNTYNFLGGGNLSSGGIQSGAGLNGQMYYFYAFSSALGTTDRTVIETTQSQYSPLPSMTLTVSSVTSTTFVPSWTAVANATTYVMYINSSSYGTVTSGQTITPGYNGPWTINVYAYNASYNLLASGYTVITILTKATMNLQNWYLPDNVTITSGYVTAWPDEMGNYNLSNLKLLNTTNTMTKVVASGTTSNAIYQNFTSNGTNACYVYGGSFSETIYVVLFAAYTTLVNGGFDEILGDTTNSYSIRFTTGINSLNSADLNYGGTNYVNGTQITPGTNTFGALNTWNIYCMYITGSMRTAITNLAILGDYASNNRSFSGYAGDFFIGNASFGTTQQQQIEGYLGYKYKCQSSLPTSHPFYSSTNSNVVLVSSYILPTQVTALTLTQLSTTSFQVSWSGSAGATSYTYYLNGTATTPSTDNGITSQTVIFTGLTAGSRYSFYFKATNSSGSIYSYNVPTTLSAFGTCFCWLDAADKSTITTSSGTTISKWTDKSSYGYQFNVCPGTNPNTFPNTSTISASNPVQSVLFNGTTSQIACATMVLPAAPYTIFVVGNDTTSSGYSYFISCYTDKYLFFGCYNNTQNFDVFCGNGSAWNDVAAMSTSISVSTLSVMGTTNNNTTMTGYVNGTSAGTKTGTSASVTGVSLGCAYTGTTGSQYLTGNICEIVMFNSVLSTTNYQYVEGSLAWKYGCQNSLAAGHPYKSSPPTGLAVWNP